MTYSQNSRVASVTTTVAGLDVYLYRMVGNEQLSQIFEYELDLLSGNNSIDLQSLLGTKITVTLELVDGGKRYFNGYATKVTQFGMLGKLHHYRVIVHPMLWFLTRRINSRIMATNKKVPEIVTAILSDYGFTVDISKLSATYTEREYCVQYRETDFNFISRLMEEEGIYYYFEHVSGDHSLFLVDAMSAHVSMPGNSTISYLPEIGGSGVPEYIQEWSLHQEVRSGKYTVKDYDFTASTVDLKESNELPGTHAINSLEIYDYPAGYTQAVGGTTYAQIRMQEQRAEFERIRAGGNVRNLCVGAKFTFADFPRDDQNREYLVISTHFQIQNNGFLSAGIPDTVTEEFQCSYEVMGTGFVYRPPRLSRIPVVQGVQTAIVVGGSSDEIATDDKGRVKVQFHWDTLGQKNLESSCWIRVAQVWAGKGWGAVFTPRVGQEVVVDFLEGNPDRPIIVGSVYNDVQTSPITFPDNKTQSGIMTRSTTSGGASNFNQLRFEDKKDSEEVFIQAEKDLNTVVKNNETLKVGTQPTDGNGNQTIDIHNNRTVTIAEGADKLTVTKGTRTVDVTGSDGTITETAGKSITLKVGNNSIVMDSSSITLTVGNNTIVMDSSSISHTVAQSTIKMDASSIKMGALTATIEGQASAELKSVATTVSADGVMTVKGATVMIN